MKDIDEDLDPRAGQAGQQPLLANAHRPPAVWNVIADILRVRYVCVAYPLWVSA